MDWRGQDWTGTEWTGKEGTGLEGKRMEWNGRYGVSLGPRFLKIDKVVIFIYKNNYEYAFSKTNRGANHDPYASLHNKSMESK